MKITDLSASVSTSIPTHGTARITAVMRLFEMDEPTWHPKKNVVVENEVEDDVILYDPVTGTVVGLNLVAGLVWDQCDGSRDVTEISDAIASMFSRTPDDITPDIRLILKQMVEKGLIQ
jgi:hypothetical protein